MLTLESFVLSSLLVLAFRVRPLSAQAGASAGVSYRETVSRVSGTAAALRYRVHQVLLQQALSVSDIAPCDCLVTTEWTRLPGLTRGRVARFRVHIMKLPNVLSATVVIEATEGPAEALTVMPAVAGDHVTALSPPVRTIVAGLREALQAAVLVPPR